MITLTHDQVLTAFNALSKLVAVNGLPWQTTLKLYRLARVVEGEANDIRSVGKGLIDEKKDAELQDFLQASLELDCQPLTPADFEGASVTGSVLSTADLLQLGPLFVDTV